MAVALTGAGNTDLSLPAAEVRLRALQERRMELLQMVAGDADSTEFDEEISWASAAILDLPAWKTEQEQVLIRFKDGIEVEQSIEYTRRRASA